MAAAAAAAVEAGPEDQAEDQTEDLGSWAVLTTSAGRSARVAGDSETHSGNRALMCSLYGVFLTYLPGEDFKGGQSKNHN